MSNREALLDAAAQCLREKGYAHTTARDLVRASGTNLGAIGYHFGSKERLLNEALYRGYEEWLELIATVAVEPGGGLWQGVRQAVQGLLETIESQRALCVAFVEALAQAERSPRLRSQMAEGYQLYRHAVALHIQAALGDPGEPDADTTALATLIIAQMDGLVIQWLLDAERLPTVAQFVASLEGALAGGAPE
jgi:AcrR family transcriptional regulator